MSKNETIGFSKQNPHTVLERGEVSGKADLAIAVNVGLADHLVYLLHGELLPQVEHHAPQFLAGYEAIPVLN